MNRAKCLPFGFPLQSWFLRPAPALILVLRFSIIIPKRAELSLREKYDARKGQRRQVNPPKVGGISQVSCAENAELAYVRSLTCNSLLMASLYSLALFSSSANISTCAVRGSTGDVNRFVEEASAWSPRNAVDFRAEFRYGRGVLTLSRISAAAAPGAVSL